MYNLNFEKLTLMTGFVVQGHILFVNTKVYCICTISSLFYLFTTAIFIVTKKHAKMRERKKSDLKGGWKENDKDEEGD